MIKKIRCKVVKSGLLSENSDILQHVSQPSSSCHKVGEAVATDVNYTDKPAKTAGWLWVCEGMTGQILDCYV